MDPKTLKFIRVDKEFIVQYQGGDLDIYAESAGVRLNTNQEGSCLLRTHQDLNAFAKAISDAWKDHERLKEKKLMNE